MPAGRGGRFEFRVWGNDLGEVIDRLYARSEHVEHRESTEIYFVVAGRCDVNPKARADLLDIKELVAERDGCEQWAVRLKASFPIPAGLIRDELYPLLGIEAPQLVQATYTMADLVALGELEAVEVSKRRHIRVMGECLAEVTAATIAGRPTTTVAIESENLAALLAARSELGLDGCDNVSYPRAIHGMLAGV